MTWRRYALAIVLGLALAPTARAQMQLAACDPGDKIDRTTIDQARKKIAQAGYRKITDLRKACDNSWHGKAEKDGQPANVVLTPEGLVLEEGE